jgi:Fe-S cluster biogenesis protein NfuA
VANRLEIQAVLDNIRPALQADGGDLELVELAGAIARVRLTGACAGCPTAHMTLHMGVETALRRLNPRLRVALVP